jgi:hypothetical protein
VRREAPQRAFAEAEASSSELLDRGEWMLMLRLALSAVIVAASSYSAYKIYQMTNGKAVRKHDTERTIACIPLRSSQCRTPPGLGVPSTLT